MCQLKKVHASSDVAFSFSHHMIFNESSVNEYWLSFRQSTRHHYESHDQAINRVHQTLDRISLLDTTTTSIPSFDEQLTVQSHLVKMRTEISRIANDAKLSPVYRSGFQKAQERAAQDTLEGAIASKLDQISSTTSQDLLSTCPRSRAVAPNQTFLPCKTEIPIESYLDHYSFSVFQTIFGDIHVEVKNHSKIIRVADRLTEYPQTPQYEKSRTLVFYPARWLLTLGINYSLYMQIRESSVKGWMYTLAVNRAVPDDALIFDFATQGNLSAIRSLMSRGLASVRDVDSYGRTALWVSYMCVAFQL